MRVLILQLLCLSVDRVENIIFGKAQFILLKINIISMELQAIKVSLFNEDEEPDFNLDQFETESNLLKNQSDFVETSLKKTSILHTSKTSQLSNPAKSHASSVLYSAQKEILFDLQRKNSGFSSISPDNSPYRNNIKTRRPLSSAMRMKNPKATAKGETIFERTSFSPTLSPERKGAYWQPWLPPLNSTVRETISSQQLKISAQSYCVMMSDTNEIIASENGQTEREIASLTKIMTAYTALNICTTFGIKIRQHYVNINKHAAYMNGTSAGLKVDEEILIIDLLYALLLPSGNDAGVALAQFFGKFLSYKFAQDRNSYDKQKSSISKFKEFKEYYDNEYDKESIKLFVFQMNKNCLKIGLKNTHFNNPTGLSDKKNYSTARDMAVFTSHCFNNLTLRMIFKKKFHCCEVRNTKLSQVRQVQWKNTNRHLFQFRQCIGVKTGITPNAGPCLSSAYRVLGRQMVIILLQCESLQARYKDAQVLYRWCRKKIRAF